MSFWCSLRGRSNPIHVGSLFGIELEVEGVSPDDVPDSLLSTFSITEDHSLRNGIELVSRPITLAQVEAVAPVYTEWASEVVTLSDRCSTHIHVNVQDMTEDQFKAFLWLCIAIEPALMSTVSEVRQENVYCYPVYKTTNLVHKYRELFTQPNSFFSSTPKYCAIGLFRLREYGTVEFRMFDGTTNGSDLVRWCSLLDSLRTKALTSTIESLRDRKTVHGLRTLLTNELNVDLSDDILEEGIRMANDIFKKRMTVEDLLSVHASLFPEEAPKQIVKGRFGAECLEQDRLGTLESYLTNFNREQFLEVYGTQPLFSVFAEISGENPVAAASVVNKVRIAYGM